MRGTPTARRWASHSARKGPWVRAWRATSSASGSSTASRKARGEAGRGDHADRVAVAAGVLGGDVAGLAADLDLDDAAGVEEGGEPGVEQGGVVDAGEEGLAILIAEAAQEVVEVVGVGELAVAALEDQLELGDGLGGEEVAQGGLAEQGFEAGVVDREGLGAALGERGVALVHEVADVVEEQRGGEGAGAAGLDLDDLDRALLDAAQEVDASGEIEGVF
jgi:hypothetical protein